MGVIIQMLRCARFLQKSRFIMINEACNPVNFHLAEATEFDLVFLNGKELLLTN